jgi:hypothetical protein
MKLRSIVLALVLGTTSIVTTGCGTTPDVIQTDISKIIAQVQSITSQICKFVPTAGTIAAIVTANNPGVTTAVAIAEAICNSLAPAPAAAKFGGVINGWMVAPRTVNGVVIHGHYIQ